MALGILTRFSTIGVVSIAVAVGLLLLALLAAAALLGFAVARYVTKPLQALRAASLSIGRGNLYEQVPVGGPEETVSLGQALDSMRTELKGLYQKLEGQVAERTEELTVLYDISRILSQSGEFDSKATRVMERLAQSARADWVTLRLPKEEEPGLHLVATAGPAVAESPPIPALTPAQIMSTAAFTEGRTIVIDDYAALPAPSQALVDLGMQSMVILPLKASERTLGLVIVISKEKSHFTPELVDLLAAVGEGLGTLLENAQLDQQLQTSREELAVVDEVARIITSTLDIDKVYDEFATEVKKLVDFDRISISLWDREAGVFTMKHTVGQEAPGQNVGDMVAIEGTPTQVAMDTGRTLILSDTAEGQYTTDHRFLKAGLRSTMLVPLTYRGSNIGVIALRSRNIGAYALKDQVILERLAHQIAPAVAHSELFEQSKRAEEAQRRWAEENSVMAEVGRVISSSLDINEIYTSLGEEICKLIPFDRMSLNLANYERGTMSPRWGLGTDIPGRSTGDEVPLAESFAAEVVRTRSPILLEAETEADVERRFPLMMPAYNVGLRSFLAVPLLDRDVVIGVFQLQSKSRGVYTQRHLELLERIGSQIAGSIANSQLYEKLKQAQEAVRTSEELFRQIAENIPEVVSLIDHKSYEILYINPAVEEIWGRSRESFYQQPISWLDAVYPDDFERVNVSHQKARTTGEFREEYRIVRPDGSIRWVQALFVPIRNELGQIFRNVGIVEDVTERRQAEDKIKDSLQEKEVLLKEINHRVKNNLQIISSLLSLQSRDIQDEQALRSFQVSQDRIKAMALVHEKLYLSDDLARIDFGEYIKSLATDLGSSYGLGTRDIELKIDVENILLGVGTAIPCGVIVNELVANSLKHAFPGDRSGEIAISFRLVDGQYTMIFKDDGVGLPKDLDINHPSSLGLTIVNAVTGQLGGTIGFVHSGGTEVSITFPAK